MDPYEYARQQGQTIGSSTGQPEEPDEADDLMDLLLHAYDKAGRMNPLTPECQDAVATFVNFANDYLATHRVVSTGMVNGEFSLVFETGQAVPLATSAPVSTRPDSTIPITRPRDSQMKGMPVVDNSVPVTTGQTGSPVRRPK